MKVDRSTVKKSYWESIYLDCKLTWKLLESNVQRACESKAYDLERILGLIVESNLLGVESDFDGIVCSFESRVLLSMLLLVILHLETIGEEEIDSFTYGPYEFSKLAEYT